jgi:DMSO/TMAO reductase YedYZ molybdopterin-dependent catalytic subunit
MTRREWMMLASVGLTSASSLHASEPMNLSYPLRTVDGVLTAPNLLFVRDHFSEPDVSLDTWELQIDGQVQRPYKLGFADLVELPGKKVETVLECAGNAAGGSAVSNGFWEGVPISSLLDAAQPAPNAAFVLLEGADSGKLVQDGPALPYAQLVPLAKCREALSLVAFKYNDLTLPKRNGFPARALFPGWYGMDSVKWLRRITVLSADDRETVFHKSGMTRLYNRVTATNGALHAARLNSIQVKSVLAWPADGMKLPAGRHVIWGFAWSGTGAVRHLSISLDGGKSWNPAKLGVQSETSSWARWNYGWEARPGDYILMSRASDATGKKQPVARDPARKDAYELNWCAPVRCSVR